MINARLRKQQSCSDEVGNDYRDLYRWDKRVNPRQWCFCKRSRSSQSHEQSYSDEKSNSGLPPGWWQIYQPCVSAVGLWTPGHSCDLLVLRLALGSDGQINWLDVPTVGHMYASSKWER